MSTTATTIRQIGPLRFSLQSACPDIVARVERLLADFPPADGNASVIAEVVQTEQGFTLHVDDRPGGRNRSPDELELRLTRALNRLVLDAQPDFLHLHAGAVRRGHDTVLVVGTSGAGKSTLVAKLVAEGWGYLSDEQIGVWADGTLVGYPRPITLRRDSWALFEAVAAVPDAADHSGDRVEVPASAFGPIDQGEPGGATLVVIPDAGVETSEVDLLSAAELFSTLVADTLDLERAGHDGVAAMLAIVAAAPGVRISGRNLQTTLGEIERMATSSTAGSVCVDHLGANGPASATGRVEAWLFADDSAVLYDHDSGTCAVLDRAGFEAWGMLAQPRERWPTQLAESAFVAELTEAGLLETEAKK